MGPGRRLVKLIRYQAKHVETDPAVSIRCGIAFCRHRVLQLAPLLGKSSRSVFRSRSVACTPSDFKCLPFCCEHLLGHDPAPHLQAAGNLHLLSPPSRILQGAFASTTVKVRHVRLASSPLYLHIVLPVQGLKIQALLTKCLSTYCICMYFQQF